MVLAVLLKYFVDWEVERFLSVASCMTTLGECLSGGNNKRSFSQYVHALLGLSLTGLGLTGLIACGSSTASDGSDGGVANAGSSNAGSGGASGGGEQAERFANWKVGEYLETEDLEERYGKCSIDWRNRETTDGISIDDFGCTVNEFDHLNINCVLEVSNIGNEKSEATTTNLATIDATDFIYGGRYHKQADCSLPALDGHSTKIVECSFVMTQEELEAAQRDDEELYIFAVGDKPSVKQRAQATVHLAAQKQAVLAITGYECKVGINPSNSESRRLECEIDYRNYGAEASVEHKVVATLSLDNSNTKKAQVYAPCNIAALAAGATGHLTCNYPIPYNEWGRLSFEFVDDGENPVSDYGVNRRIISFQDVPFDSGVRDVDVLKLRCKDDIYDRNQEVECFLELYNPGSLASVAQEILPEGYFLRDVKGFTLKDCEIPSLSAGELRTVPCSGYFDNNYTQSVTAAMFDWSTAVGCLRSTSGLKLTALSCDSVSGNIDETTCEVSIKNEGSQDLAAGDVLTLWSKVQQFNVYEIEEKCAIPAIKAGSSASFSCHVELDSRSDATSVISTRVGEIELSTIVERI